MFVRAGRLREGSGYKKGEAGGYLPVTETGALSSECISFLVPFIKNTYVDFMIDNMRQS